jgi:hypothetical protein
MAKFDLRFAVRLISVLLAVEGAARAQDDEDKGTLAQARFRDGRQMMSEGRYAEAAERLAESQRLDPAPGTMANLAYCYDKLGRTSAAWVTYKETARLARQSGKSEWASQAEASAAAIERAAPRLVIQLSERAETPGLALSVDDVALPRPLWSESPPAAMGRHEIRASAAGKRSWSSPFEVPEGGAPTTLVVPPLEPEEAPPPPPPQDRPGTEAHPPAARMPSIAPRRVAALAMGAVSLAELASGAALVTTGKITYDQTTPECSGATCTERGTTLRSRAIAEANFASVALAVGAASAACAAVLWWTSPRAIEVGASIGRTDVELRAGGRW